MTDQDNLRDRIAAVLYIESSEAEDGDVVWESPEAIAEEIESWGRFAQAIIDDLHLESYPFTTHDGHTTMHVHGWMEKK